MISISIKSCVWGLTGLVILCVACIGGGGDGDDDNGTDDDLSPDDTLDDDAGSTTTTSVTTTTQGTSTTIPIPDSVLDGGAPGHSGVATAIDAEGRIYFAAAKSVSLLVYRSEAGGFTAEQAAPYADEPSMAIDGNGFLHLAFVNLDGGGVSYAANASGSWAIETISDVSCGLRCRPDIALDDAGAPHVIFLSGSSATPELHHAQWTQSGWSEETIGYAVCPSCLSPASLAVDGAGKSHVAYLGAEGLVLFYATDASGAWTTEVVAANALLNFLLSTTIFLDSADRPHIGYQVESYYLPADFTMDSELRHATKTSGVWTSEVVDSTDVPTQGINVAHGFWGTDGEPHFVYSLLPGWIRHVYRQNGAWSASTVLFDLSIYFDRYEGVQSSDGAIHVGYQLGGALRYLKAAGGLPTNTTVDDGRYIYRGGSMGLTHDGKGRIVYQKSGYGFLPAIEHIFLASEDETGWTTQQVDPVDARDWLWSPKLGLDQDDYVHIAFTSGSMPMSIVHMTNAGGDWVREAVDSMMVYEAPEIGLAVEDSGTAHISYHKIEAAPALMYATNASGAWETQFVAGALDADEPVSSIALDSAGHVHIAFQDSTGACVHASNASGDWVLETVDGGLTGSEMRSSIAVGPAGEIGIAYSDEAQGQLKYAANASGSWVIETQFDANVPQIGVSLLIDDNATAHIAFSEENALGVGSLQYATNAGGSWSVDAVGGVGYNWGGPSLAMDGAGLIRLAYSREYGLQALELSAK